MPKQQQVSKQVSKQVSNLYSTSSPESP